LGREGKRATRTGTEVENGVGTEIGVTMEVEIDGRE